MNTFKVDQIVTSNFPNVSERPKQLVNKLSERSVGYVCVCISRADQHRYVL